MSQYSAEQKLTLFEDIREIRNEAGRMTACYLMSDQGKIFHSYWSCREDVCLTTNEGYYTGRDAVQGYYDSITERSAAISKMVRDKFPEKVEHFSDEELFGAGEMDYKSIDTYVIEVAGDRETAKGLWIIRGSEARMTSGGPQAFWEWGWFAADFVLEGGAWKIWHLQYLQEIMRPSGQSWTGPELKYDRIPEFAEADHLKLAQPNYPSPVRARYDCDRPFTPGPRVPEPYEHFEDTFSYGCPM